MAGQYGGRHGLVAGVAVPVLEGAEAGAAGFKVWGKVARPAAASLVGRNSGPFCPQPANAPVAQRATASRAKGALTRICKTFNMVKL
jgi:hypothetical protein